MISNVLKGIILLFIVIVVLSVTGCSKQKQSEYNGNNVVHLPNIPTEITFRGKVYNVEPIEVKEDSIGAEIGTTEKEGFRVFEIKGAKPENKITILVREKDPIIHYKATIKQYKENRQSGELLSVFFILFQDEI